MPRQKEIALEEKKFNKTCSELQHFTVASTWEEICEKEPERERQGLFVRCRGSHRGEINSSYLWLWAYCRAGLRNHSVRKSRQVHRLSVLMWGRWARLAHQLSYTHSHAMRHTYTLHMHESINVHLAKHVAFYIFSSIEVCKCVSVCASCLLVCFCMCPC